MEFALTRIRRWAATILLLSIIVLCLSGCTLRDTSIFSKEITMQCDAPYMITTYIKAENGAGSRETYLEIDGELHKVGLYHVSTIFTVHLEDRTPTASEILISGVWEERKGDLILYIEEDFVFDNQYEKIVLKPVENSSP